MNPLCDAPRSGEMFKFFNNLMNMAKQMVDEILPDLVIDSEEKVLKELFDVGVNFKTSLEVFLKLCEIMGKINFKFSSKKLCAESKAFGTVYTMVNEEKPVPVDHSTPQKDISFDRKADGALNDVISDSLKHRKLDEKITNSENPGSKTSKENQCSAKNGNNTMKPKGESSNCQTHGVRNDGLKNTLTRTAASPSWQGEDQKESSRWKNLLKEVTTLLDRETHVKDFYYCGVCDVGVVGSGTWNSHLKGYKHKVNCDNFDPSTSTHSCSKCGFFIFSDDQHIALILESLEHRKLDEKITNSENPGSMTSKENQCSEKIRCDAMKPKRDSTNCQTDGVINEELKNELTQTAAIPSWQGGDQEEPLRWKNLLKEVTTLLDRETHVKDFYYCGVCDVGVVGSGTWNSHLKGDRHTRKCRSFDTSSFTYSCSKCGFFIVSDDQHIALISDSVEHRKLDEKIITSENPTSKTSSVPFFKETHYSEKNGNNTMKPKRESTENYNSDIYQGNKINCDFVLLTLEISNYLVNGQSFIICYCLVCTVYCDSITSWEEHLRTAQHLRKISIPSVNFVNSCCKQCSFGLLGNEQLAIVYMSYHIENCHKHLVGKILGRYMEIKQIVPFWKTYT